MDIFMKKSQTFTPVVGGIQTDLLGKELHDYILSKEDDLLLYIKT